MKLADEKEFERLYYKVQTQGVKAVKTTRPPKKVQHVCQVQRRALLRSGGENGE